MKIYLHKNLIKILGIICVLFFCTINIYAKSKISTCLGISKIKLKDTNNNEACTSEFGTSTHGCFEYMYDIDDSLKIGTRLGIISKKINFTSGSGNKKTHQAEDNNSQYIVDTISIMFGGGYGRNISKNVSLNGKIFLGYIFVDFGSKNSFQGDVFKKNVGCFILDYLIGIEWIFAEIFGVGCDFGYRLTPEISPSKDIKLNFSGVTFTLNLSYKI
jgi:hypothetical protein